MTPATPHREVHLSRGRIALVDADDYESVIDAGAWNVQEQSPTRAYVRRTVKRDGRSVTIYMHTFLTGWPMVDHINGDGLDNRRANLRPATPKQNLGNRGRNSNNASGYKGVTQIRGGRWAAQIGFQYNGVKRGRSLGTFATAEEAARAYDAAARKQYGEFAGLNFPD